MKGQRQTLLAIAGAVLVNEPRRRAGQAEAPVSPRPATPRPSDEGAAPKAPGKLVAPFRGEAELHYTQPVTKARRQHDRDDDARHERHQRAAGRLQGRRVLVRQEAIR